MKQRNEVSSHEMKADLTVPLRSSTSDNATWKLNVQLMRSPTGNVVKLREEEDMRREEEKKRRREDDGEDKAEEDEED